jgi:hypothetical protein
MAGLLVLAGRVTAFFADIRGLAENFKPLHSDSTEFDGRLPHARAVGDKATPEFLC